MRAITQRARSLAQHAISVTIGTLVPRHQPSPHKLRATMPILLVGLAAIMVAITLGIATSLALWIERTTLAKASAALTLADREWVSLSADGLKLRISGVAPNPNAHAAALFRIESSISSQWIDDATAVALAPPRPLVHPRLYAVRQGDTLSLIGSVPEPSVLLRRITDTMPDVTITNMMKRQEETDPNWPRLTRIAIAALESSRQASVFLADRSDVVIFADTHDRKLQIDESLRPLLPHDLPLDLIIEAPRDRVPTFRFRLKTDAEAATLKTCHVETLADRQRLMTLLAEQFTSVTGQCDIALGAPNADWPEIVAASIDALFDLGGGEIDLFGTQARLMPHEAASEGIVDAVVDAFSSRLPDPYALELILPQTTADSLAEQNRYNFVAKKAADGETHIRGVIPDLATRRATRAYAEAILGGKPTTVLVTDETTPLTVIEDALIGLRCLSLLHSGELTVSQTSLALAGISVDQGTERAIEARLARGLQGRYFRLDITYDPQVLAPPEPLSDQACLARIRTAAGSRKISFRPGSAELTLDSIVTLKSVAEAMKDCTHIPFEVAGHTDSQGREEMNLRLSQQRAETVIDALLERRIATRNLTARGYGESDPIHDNSTPEGREKNRRIEFNLLTDPPTNAPQ